MKFIDFKHEEAAAMLDEQSGTLTSGTGAVRNVTGTGYRPNAYGAESRPAGTPCVEYGDSGGASRFFYTAKAAKSERGSFNDHPTVKPLALMKYLCVLTDNGGEILDPFGGSMTTLVAAREAGRKATAIELDEKHCRIGVKRLAQGVLFGSGAA